MTELHVLTIRRRSTVEMCFVAQERRVASALKTPDVERMLAYDRQLHA